MTYSKQMKNAALALGVFAGLSLAMTEVLAENVKRSCNAHYNAQVTRIDFKDSRGVEKSVGVPMSVMPVHLDMAKFSGRAGCGDLVPNRCRERARDRVLDCAKAHAMSPTKLPAACQTDSIQNYPVPDLMPSIKKAACGYLKTRDGLDIKTFLPRDYKVEVLLSIFVDGDDGCGFKHPPKSVLVDGKPIGDVAGNKIFYSQPIHHISVTCP